MPTIEAIYLDGNIVNIAPGLPGNPVHTQLVGRSTGGAEFEIEVQPKNTAEGREYDVIINKRYKKDGRDEPGYNGGGEFDPDLRDRIPVPLSTPNDRDVNTTWENFIAVAKAIESQNVTYSTLTQNSNTFIYNVLRASGLEINIGSLDPGLLDSGAVAWGRALEIPYNIKGTSGNDVFHGYTENDNIRGNKGDDYIYGGGGKDEIRGGQGNDVLFGEDGSDTLIGGKGDDILLGDSNDENGAKRESW